MATVVRWAKWQSSVRLAVIVVEEQIVSSDDKGKKVGENTDGIVLSENEVKEDQQAARHAHVPERARENRLARGMRGGQLHEPSPGKKKNPGESDDFSDIEADAEKFSQRDGAEGVHFRIDSRKYFHGSEDQGLAIQSTRRASNQRTPIRSQIPRSALPPSVYLETPVWRGR